MRACGPVVFLLTVLVGLVPCPRAEACPQQGTTVRPGETASKQGKTAGQPAAAKPSKFARFVPVGEDEGRFEVAITTYVDPQGAEVSLISSVHIADAAHYADLQRDFKRYDVLLYELVASPNRRPKPSQKIKPRGLVSLLQTALKNGLGLEFQLNAIDYTPDNFVHADLTPQSFSKKMEEKGETFFHVFMRLAGRQMAAEREKREKEEEEEERNPGKKKKPNAFDLVSAFQKKEGRHQLRMMFAQQLESIEAIASGAGDGGTVLLEGRNDRAVEVLKEQLKAGKKKIGIYYGGAHMTGIEKTLRQDMGFRKTGERWLVAWDITKRPDPVRKKRSEKKK